MNNVRSQESEQVSERERPEGGKRPRGKGPLRTREERGGLHLGRAGRLAQGISDVSFPFTFFPLAGFTVKN